jgi:hypothetical protein
LPRLFGSSCATSGAQGEIVPSLDEIYRRFGEVAEAAQLLETELGNLAIDVGIAENASTLLNNPTNARALLGRIDRKTLGRLLCGLKGKSDVLLSLEKILDEALRARNRLSHSFYREHNFRRNSEDGRAIMLDDLCSLHEAILGAYKALLEAFGVDFEDRDMSLVPTKHIKLKLGTNESST